MPLGSKNKLSVDLGDLHDECENLTRFLHTKLKAEITVNQNRFVITAEALAPKDLEHAVNKFIYHRNLNSTHFVSLDGNQVKINRFKNAKPKKPEKTKKSGTQHQSVTQSWGL